MKTESNIKPAAHFEIEALPQKEGAPCVVILYTNIEGPLTKQTGSEGVDETYYAYDRYTVDTAYRENLQESVETHYDEWLQKGIDAEAAGDTPKTELDILREQVLTLQEENQQLKSTNAEMSAAIDDLIIASLGGDELV